MELRDDILKYVGIFRKRKSVDERIRFLSALNEDFSANGFSGELFETVYGKRRSISLYTDNIDSAKTIIITHYDNPLWFFKYRKGYPFNEERLKRFGFLVPLVLTALVLLVGIAFYMGIAGKVFADGVNSLADVLSYLFLGALLILIIYISKGIETTQVVNNTGSILVAREVAKKLSNKDKKNVAFVFVDSGLKDRFGYLTFRDYYENNDLTAKVIALDMLGANNTYLNHHSFKTPILSQITRKMLYFGGGNEVNQTIVQDLNALITEESINEAVEMIIEKV